MSLAGPRLSPASSPGVTGEAAPKVASVQPMTILIVTGIFPPEIGGPATYVPLIAARLAERSHNVTVLTSTARGGHDDAQYPFEVVRARRRGPLPLRMLGVITAVVRHGRKADVLYVNGLPLQSAVANLVLRKPMVMKVVGDMAWERATLRGWTQLGFDAFQTRRSSARIRVLKFLRSWAVRRAAHVIAPSQYLAGCVAGWGLSHESVSVVYNAADAVDDVTQVDLPLNTRTKAVVVGRLVPWKHVDEIIQAVAALRDVGLVVVGDGPERARLEGLTRSLGQRDTVFFAGSRAPAETRRIMSSCDLLVLNSTYEGLPHVAIEAMSLGLPVVATKAGGTPEVVEDGRTGLLVEPHDVASLSAAVVRLANSSELRRDMGDEGLARVRERFNVSTMVDATETTLWDAWRYSAPRRTALVRREPSD